MQCSLLEELLVRGRKEWIVKGAQEVSTAMFWMEEYGTSMVCLPFAFMRVL